MSVSAPMPLRAPWLLARAGWRRTTTYKLALVAGLATNSVFGVIRASIMLAAIGSAGVAIQGYDAAHASSFVWWSQGLIASMALFGWNDIAVRIKSGDIAVDFARPIDPFVSYLATDLGRAAVSLLSRGIPSVLIGAVTFGVAVPGNPVLWVVGLVSVVLGVVVSFACRYVVNMLALWLVEIRGVLVLYMVLSGLFAGLFMPVPWFPEWLRRIMEATPFPSILQGPVDILSGRLDLGPAGRVVAVQVGWVVGLVALAHLVTRAGRRHLEVQGG